MKKRLSIEAAAAANRNGRWKNQMRQVAHNGCCRRVAQTRALCSVLWKLVISEGLAKALGATEMPLVKDICMRSIPSATIQYLIPSRNHCEGGFHLAI